jgi:hypothetical protein
MEVHQRLDHIESMGTMTSVCFLGNFWNLILFTLLCFIGVANIFDPRSFHIVIFGLQKTLMKLTKMVRCRRTVEFVQFAIRLDRFGEDKRRYKFVISLQLKVTEKIPEVCNSVLSFLLMPCYVSFFLVDCV